MQHQPKKRFGQNFLTDKNLLKKIVLKSNIKDKYVIEVGPGQGALTSYLALEAKHVTCFEIDYTLKPILDHIQSKHSNLDIIYEDFMKQDISTYHDQIHVVANVPYYITTPIIFKILETKEVLTASLMIQKEVCDRLTSKPGEKTYNQLSVIIQYFARVYKILDVKKHMFHPKPKVDSAVIRIEKRKTPLLNQKNEQIFIRIVKQAFKQKRKTLVNNWFEAFNIPKEKLHEFLNSLNINQNIRAEKISLETFIHIAKVWPYDI